MATVSWSRRAIASLNEEMAWIAQSNPLAAQRLSEQLREAVDRLDQFPNRGRRGQISDTREIVVREYIIIYRVRSSQVIVARVIHGRRRR